MPWETEYAAIRARNLQVQRERRRQVLALCPALAAWESSYLEAQRRRASSAGNAAPNTNANPTMQVERLLAQRAAILESVGLPSDYLSLPTDCPICRDYGYVDGKPCACLEKKRFASRTRRSNLVGLETQSFSRFDETVFPEEGGQRERMKKLRDLCVDYAADFPHNDPKNLLFIGNAGLGKSFLLNSVGRAVLDRGFSVLKTTANQFHQMLMDDVIRRRDMAPLRELESCDLLLYDDLGCEPNVKGIVENYFFALIAERHSAGRAMVTASNCSANEIAERYGERTLSRLLDRQNTRALAFKGQDLRLLRTQ